MIIHDCIQGTQKWLQLRAGIPTASEFSRILTPTGKESKQQDDYMYDLLAERIMGKPLMPFQSRWMERGQQLEAEAVAFYELQRDCETFKIGFITTDDGRKGCSPDRGIDKEGLLEIKCPSPGQHMRYLFEKPVDAAYYPQIMGQLWIAERKYLDILSYNPELPPALVRVERDEEYIAKLSKTVTAFCIRLEECYVDAFQRGWADHADTAVAGGQKITPLPPLDELLRMMKESLVETKP